MKAVKEIVIEELQSKIYELDDDVKIYLLDKDSKLTPSVSHKIDKALGVKDGTTWLYNEQIKLEKRR